MSKKIGLKDGEGTAQNTPFFYSLSKACRREDRVSILRVFLSLVVPPCISLFTLVLDLCM